MDKQHIENQFKSISEILIKEMNPDGFWTGQLSSSALATAVSIVAFKLISNKQYDERINKGLKWLVNHINSDGGFGDTPESESNLSTTLLSYSAIRFCGNANINCTEIIGKIESYLSKLGIDIKSDKIAKSVLDFYGKDLTFSVPILSMLSICGILNEKGLKKIPQLPFELALLPNSLYQFFNLQVVSYAIPALIAVGIYLFKKKNSRNPIFKFIRNKSIKPSLKKLELIMPESGGFLEAIPLTAFSAMCLISSDFSDTAVVEKSLKFLENQQRVDGSWPIDTDLSTWLTTLSIKAFGPKLREVLQPEQVQKLKKQLLNLQYKNKHPFNQAKPGGWGWTSFSGSVPDADDTPGAILALIELYEGQTTETVSILQGCMWLTDIQNSDGGIPTFCRGWGRLPFDQSCADLTGHCLLAWIKALDMLGDKVPKGIQKQIQQSIKRSLLYLQKHQNQDGSWLPLWFGSQNTLDKHNPVYGTAKVGIYLFDCLNCKNLNGFIRKSISGMAIGALEFIEKQQNSDGSWGALKGTLGTIEETSLALSLIVDTNPEATSKGFEWIESYIKENGLKSSPIGLYFASLWYDEKLYPVIYYLESLRKITSSL
jgi:squalene-hopene/tetraprenyl-beta-curcumene cyclase